MTDSPGDHLPAADEPLPPTVPPTPPPTVVQGYPDLTGPAPAALPLPKGFAALPGQVRTVRLLAVASFALLILLTLGLGVTLVGTLSQIGDLNTQVAALNQRIDAATTPQAAAPATTGQESQTAQLGPATTLEGVDRLPGGADPTGAVLIGDPNASNVVEVYVDYQCPYCQRWEQEIGAPLIAKAIQPGSDLLVKQYNLAFLGEVNSELTPAGASARAANAAACVLDADGAEVFVAFSSAVFGVAEPTEPPGQFPTEQLVSLAQESGASPTATACIQDEVFVPFAAATTKGGFVRGVGGTPTVVVNGQTVANPFTDPALGLMLTSG